MSHAAYLPHSCVERKSTRRCHATSRSFRHAPKTAARCCASSRSPRNSTSSSRSTRPLGRGSTSSASHASGVSTATSTRSSPSRRATPSAAVHRGLSRAALRRSAQGACPDDAHRLPGGAQAHHRRTRHRGVVVGERQLGRRPAHRPHVPAVVVQASERSGELDSGIRGRSRPRRASASTRARRRQPVGTSQRRRGVGLKLRPQRVAVVCDQRLTPVSSSRGGAGRMDSIPHLIQENCVSHSRRP